MNRIRNRRIKIGALEVIFVVKARVERTPVALFAPSEALLWSSCDLFAHHDRVPPAEGYVSMDCLPFFPEPV